MASSDKKKLKEAKKQLSNSKARLKTQTQKDSSLLDKLKNRIEEIKETVNTDEKREYSSIDDEQIPYTLASEYIPLKNIKQGIIETTDGRFLKILQIAPVNYRLKEENQKELIISEFTKYLRVCPSKFQIKCISKQSPIRKMLNIINMDKAQETSEEALAFYDDQMKFIAETAQGESIARTFYMIIEYIPETRLSAHDFDAARKQLEEAENDAKTYLGRCGNKVYDLSESPSQNQIEILYTILNRNLSTEIPFEIHAEDFEDNWLNASVKNTDTNNIKLREYISPSVLDFTDNRYVVCDGVYMTAIAIASNGYLTDVPDTWISMLTNLGEGIDVDIHVLKENRDNIRSKIYRTSKFKRLRLEDAREQGDESDSLDSLFGAVQSSKYLQEGLKNGQDFFWVNTIIYVTARTYEGWEEKMRAVEKRLKSDEFRINTLLNMQEDAFFSYLPFCNLEKNIFNITKQNVLTEGLASFYPFTSYEMSSENGILFGIDEANKSLVTLDIFDTKVYSNANMVILGTSGAGKSYTLMLIALRYRLKHIPTWIIVPEKAFEFSRLCEGLGGEFISISPSSNKNINIMEIRERDNEASRYIDGVAIESSLLVEKVQSLLIFFSIVIPDITYEEKNLLDDVIVNTYHDFKIFDNNESLYLRDSDGNKIIDPDTGKYKLKKMPLLGDVYNRIEKLYKDEKNEDREQYRRIATILRRLVYGSAKNFNQPTNVNLDNEFTIIDVSNLTGDMLLVGMYIALDYVCSKAHEDRTQKKTIIIDEMWKLLGASSNRLAAEYVLNLYKTIRGYGGSVIGATQNLTDFRALDDGKYGNGIINNSEIKIALMMKPHEIKEVKEALGLTSDEAKKILTLNHQALLLAGGNNIVVNIEASKLEHNHITTDRFDLQKIVEEAKEKENN